MGILDKIFGSAAKETISAVGGVIDSLSTTDSEKLEARRKITEVVLSNYRDVASYQRDVIVAEAKSESWLTKSWRPITMLSFILLIFLRYTGIVDYQIPIELEGRLLDIIELGIGGYVASRGIEKGIKAVTESVDMSFLKKKDRKDYLKDLHEGTYR